jgi:hypothetical protein
LPLIQPDDIEWSSTWSSTYERLRKISVGRCARVSYLTHDGKRDQQADIDLHDRLLTSGHWSPFEHVAEALAVPPVNPGPEYLPAHPGCSGNFRTGWRQYRKLFSAEYVAA